MNEHPGHAKRISHQTGVLATGAAKAIEHVASDVIAALDRDFLDRIGHVLDRDLDKSVGDFLGRSTIPDLLRKLAKTVAHGLLIERLILLGAKYFRKKFGDEFADHDIGIGYRQRTAPAVTFRAGISAGA